MGQQQSNKINEPLTFGYYTQHIPESTTDSIYSIVGDTVSIASDYEDTLKDEEGWSKLTAIDYKRMNSILDLSSQSLIKLSSSIASLDNLTKLDL
ncbi:hypothetical protein G6F35_002582 [Rhizopus arrhizus]|nr:hypothetical protein G6F35_002582 [Rhizopus arrhizus]